MPAHTARSRSLLQQNSVLGTPQMAERKEVSTSAATRCHPYAKEHLVQGKLGTPTAYQISQNGQKTHPDWVFRGSRYGDIGLESSDGVYFWVPPYVLMAFSDTLRERIQSESQERRSSGPADNGSRQLAANNASQSRQSDASAEVRRNIVFDLQTTHHRVLAMFLAFTKGDHNAIEIYTALHYRQCVSFARTYRTTHFLTLLTEKVLPKVIDLDPMGTWAYACVTDDDELAKQCFAYMADHWCITVESETRLASWSTFATGVYSTDTPIQCADAFASQIGLAKFRAFRWACDRALVWAGENGRALDEQSQRDLAVSSTRMLVESETNYIVVEGQELWERIYSDTEANATFNLAENEIIVWVDDMEETASEAMISDHDARHVDSDGPQRFVPELSVDSEAGQQLTATPALTPARTESDALVSPELVYQTEQHDVSPRQRIHSSGSFPPLHYDSPARHSASDDMMVENMPNGHAQDQHSLDEFQTFAGNGARGVPADVRGPNDPQSDEAMEDDLQPTEG
ncbi:hypothetical protein QFC21_001462 [Naganishia friedmannii]|uniref:Uncharacterized protein n=1 Tax=Naganishia friedmannii TaxID=89922 RepID=A0ACC2W5G3_9TREE|nr:hypothetical protein QFC21_001462 [Naganishia friedmannii]